MPLGQAESLRSTALLGHSGPLASPPPRLAFPPLLSPEHKHRPALSAQPPPPAQTGATAGLGGPLAYPEELLLVLPEDVDHEKQQVVVVHPVRGVQELQPAWQATGRSLASPGSPSGCV